MSQNERRPLKGAATDTAKDNPFIHLHRQRRAVAKPTADTHIPATGYEWMRWAREREIHPPAARHLLLLLSTYTDEHGVCWPGMVKLSKQMGLSPRRIPQAVGSPRRRRTAARQAHASEEEWAARREPLHADA